MKLIRFILLFLILSQYSFSQDNCPEYDRLIEEAGTFMKKSDYRNALYKYNSAKTCSPSRRKEVDEKINQLFERIETERIKAVANEGMIKLQNQQLLKAKQNEMMLKEKNKRDSIKNAKEAADNFAKDIINRNRVLFNSLSAAGRELLLEQAESMRLQGHGNDANLLAASLLLLDTAKYYSTIFSDLYKEGLKITERKDFFDKTSAISHIGYITYDKYYYWAREKISQAKNLLPEVAKEYYEEKIKAVDDTLIVRRKLLEQNYWLADTVIDLYEKENLFTQPSPDNQNFIWCHLNTSFEDYKKRKLRFLNLSLKDFSLTTDSSIQLPLKGKIYSILASDADYRYMIVKESEYSLKKNLFYFEKNSDSDPTFTDVHPLVIKLIDKNGNILNDFSSYPVTAYFFSPDANFLATWIPQNNNSFELILFNVKTKSFWKLPNAHFANTMSFSSDSRTMIYYNDSTQTFNFLDLTGKKPEIITSFSPGIPNIQNIDFTGNSSFLKINSNDKILLYNIAERKVLFQFDSNLVKNFVVSPDKKNLLITCKRKGSSNGYLTYLVDMKLSIQDKLYSDCESFFFTPDGKYIVAYDQWNIMRWNTDKTRLIKNEFRACMGLAELLGTSGVPFNYFQTLSDAAQVEKAARKFYDIGKNHKDIFKKDSVVFDSILAILYLKQSQLLFDRLKIGDAQGILKERIPFFYDWSNHIRIALGNRDFYEQITAQQFAVEIFDRLVNTPDSVYPQLLYYAANGNMLLGNLYDSLHSSNLAFIDLLKKEISLREKVFAKDPENTDNIYWVNLAYQKFSRISKSVGRRNLLNKQYQEGLLQFRTLEEYLSRGMKWLPESYYLEDAYINVLTELGSSYLYTYANKPSENKKELDSAIYFSDKAISFSPGSFDYAFFLTIKANAYLLRDNELSKALELYDKVLRDYPEFKKETMLNQLQLLREAGADETKISKAEEFIRKG